MSAVEAAVAHSPPCCPYLVSGSGRAVLLRALWFQELRMSALFGLLPLGCAAGCYCASWPHHMDTVPRLGCRRPLKQRKGRQPVQEVAHPGCMRTQEAVGAQLVPRVPLVVLLPLRRETCRCPSSARAGQCMAWRYAQELQRSPFISASVRGLRSGGADTGGGN